VIEVTPLVVVGVGAAGFLIGFAKAGIGGSLGPLVTVLAVLVLPPQTAIGVLLPMLMVGDAFALGALWQRWDLREVGRLLPGMLVGVGGGTYLLAEVESTLLARLLGALMLVFVGYWLLESRITRLGTYRRRRWHGYLAGGVAGVTSAVAHSGGPPVAVYLLLQRVQPIPFVATTTLAFAIINAVKVPAYLAAGLFDLQLQLQLAWALALIPVGVLVGRRLVGRIDRQLFHRISVLLLACSGTYLLLA
jgi:uncharacterized protein